MERHAETASKTVDLCESDLQSTILAKEPVYSSFEAKLAKLRDACQNLIFVDYDVSTSKVVEPRLWEAHGQVNKRFRSFLANFRGRDGKKKHVERRKAEKLYLDFIKSSMRFYRGLIQRLASHFRGVPEVFEVARKFNLDTLSVDPPVRVELEMKQQLLRLCHAILIHLGDLSRYRETELNQTERNWGPARGYYDLASALDPTSGQSFNQLAVIALADKDHLRAVYYLLRALTVANPPPGVRANLDLELKKIRTKHERLEPLYPKDSSGVLRELEVSFLQFHARCFRDADSADLSQQRDALLTAIAKCIGDQASNGHLRKMCMINVSACKYASERAKDDDEEDQVRLDYLSIFVKLLSVNLATMSILLRMLRREVRRPAQAEEGRLEPPPESFSRITPTARRILPLLRTYSAWLLSNARYLSHCEDAEVTHDFWNTYTKCLSRLIDVFSIREIADIPYLLQEDEDALAFTGMEQKAVQLHFTDPAGSMKSARSAVKHSEADKSAPEMLYRVKSLITDAIYLYTHKEEFAPADIPFVFANKQFVYLAEDEQPESSPMQGLVEVHSSETINGNGNHSHETESHLDQGTLSDIGIGSAAAEMEQMVDDIVGPESRKMKTTEATLGEISSLHRNSLEENVSRGSVTARDFVRHIHQSSPASAFTPPGYASPRQSPLPSVFQSPFTPRSGERLGSSSRPNSANQLPLPSTAPPVRSSAVFETGLARQQQAIEAKTSPVPTMQPTALSNYYQTPTGFDTFVRNNVQTQSDSSPWQSSVHSATTSDTTKSTKRVSSGSPFGAIGAGRPGGNTKTPTSGQLD